MGRISQRLGKAGESQAMQALYRLGVGQVEEIGTPVTLKPINPSQNIYKIIWRKRVIADHRGVAKGGISVLAEVKTVFGRNLQYGDLRDHQPGALEEHARLGGISLLVWVTDNGVHIMRFPIEGFLKGKGLTQARAEAITINSETELLQRK